MLQTIYYKKAGIIGIAELEVNKHYWRDTEDIQKWLKDRKITQAWLKHADKGDWIKLKFYKIAGKKRQFKSFALPSIKMLPAEISMFELIKQE